MKKHSKILAISFLSGFSITSMQAQQTVPATGGNATGSGGSACYTVGQTVYYTFSGTDGTVFQGVQQPYEISIITAAEDDAQITLKCIVYPNPTRGLIRLVVGTFSKESLRFQLYDINGVLLRDKKVEENETEISMEDLIPAIYFLKVIRDNRKVKVFKIVKN